MGDDMTEQLFYVRSCHSDTGSAVMFHGKKGESGYTSDIRKAQQFNLLEAQNWADSGRGDMPLLRSVVDRMTVNRVDMQYLDREEARKHPGKAFFICTNFYDGNDVGFYSEGRVSCNIDDATEYVYIEQDFSWPISYLKTIARPVFLSENIGYARWHTSRAGIKYPKKKRPTSGKTRMNCPCCGKISWQDSPYDFISCSDPSCEGRGVLDDSHLYPY
jgi:hypothetical protein